MTEDFFHRIKDGPNKGLWGYRLHNGQALAWGSDKRYIFVLAGTQSGKTVFGPIWMDREIKRRGAGEYLVVSPTYTLQKMKVVPEYVRFFERIQKVGVYRISDRTIYGEMKGEYTGLRFTIYFASADNPESLESATAKAAHLDEVGQNSFRLAAWEAIQRRLSIHRGRVLATTTIYNLGWMKSEIYNRWRNGDQDIAVIQFSSIMNPAFPKEEYYRMKKIMPRWKFKMFYDGQYDRPAGMIYDNFDEDLCWINPIEIPQDWPVRVAHDFGPVNLVALWYAEQKFKEGKSNYYLYRSYHKGNRTIENHARYFKKVSKYENIIARVGGSGSEEQWRTEFKKHGWPIAKPKTNDVEIGINGIYTLHADNRIYAFNTLKEYHDEKMSYSRKLDKNGQITDEIEDKNSFHHMDAERYFGTLVVKPSGLRIREFNM